MNIILIILAAGEGNRLKVENPKPYALVNNKTLIEYSLDKFRKIKEINKIVVVYNKKHRKILYKINLKNIIKIVGGNTRAKSTFLALKAIKKFKPSRVVIHDAARPNTSVKLIKKILKELKKHNAVVPGIKLRDTIKFISRKKSLINLDRKNFLLTQTPQGFSYKDIFHLNNKYKNFSITDDSSLLINDNRKLKIIEGEHQNLKITNNQDLELFKNIAQKKLSYGIGFDIHGLEKGRKLYLGGIKISYHSGLKGHSDGDVIIHSLIDGLLGACKLKDIGTLFSDKSSKFKNIRSIKLLKKVLDLIKLKGYSINNIDINVIAERPKINKYRNKIINSICKICDIKSDQVNIKGKTTEKLGLIGKEKAIAAEVITSVIKYD